MSARSAQSVPSHQPGAGAVLRLAVIQDRDASHDASGEVAR